MTSARIDVMMGRATTPVLEVIGIRKSFGDLEVLRGVSLTAERGDVISVIGSSGSGKSTLLRCINLLERPNAGSVAVAGEVLGLEMASDGMLRATDVKQLQRIRAEIAMVFQNFNLWSHKTALENVIEAPIHVLKLSKDEAVARARRDLAKVDLSNIEDRYPAYLSGGQQQRVAIARALAMDPQVMLFDEPTSALDPELAGEVLAVLRTLAKEGRTMIVVTHEMSFARGVSKRVVFLDEGEIAEEGEPHALFAQPRTDRLRRFINKQS
ncbi:MAG: ABC transporter ATP-binding protein [Burkholderiaceae bacterium]